MRSDSAGQLFSVFHAGERFDLCLLHALHERHPRDLVVSHDHVHAVYHVVLFLGGENSFSLAGKIHEAAPGVLALAAPGEPHEFRPRRPGGVEYLEATFELRSPRRSLTLPWPRLLELWFGGSCPELATPARPPAGLRHQLASALATLGRVLAEPGIDTPFTRARALLDLAWLLPRACGRDHAIEPLPLRLQRVARHLDAHFMRRTTVAELARMAGLSPSRFARAFASAFGMPPIDYLIERRLAEAERLLRETDLPQRAVAHQTGFADEFYFSRQFRRRRGRPPGSLRPCQHTR